MGNSKVLKIVIIIVECFACIVGVLGIIAFFIILATGGGVLNSIAVLLGGIFYFAFLYMLPAAVKLLIEISENTKIRG